MEVSGIIDSRPVFVSENGVDLLVSYTDVEDEKIYVLKDAYLKMRCIYISELGYSKPANEDEDEYYFNEYEVESLVERNACEYIEERISKLKLQE